MQTSRRVHEGVKALRSLTLLHIQGRRFVGAYGRPRRDARNSGHAAELAAKGHGKAATCEPYPAAASCQQGRAASYRVALAAVRIGCSRKAIL